MLNPMGRTYQGYARADESLLEEEDENRDSYDEEDLEAGRRDQTRNLHLQKEPKSKADGKRRVSWRTGASEMNVLHPNIHREDKLYENESSDDEVPQSFMIEATANKPAKTKANAAAVHAASHSSPRQAANPIQRRNLSQSPNTVGASETSPPVVSIPPKSPQLTVDANRERTPQSSSPTHHSDHDRQPKQMRGLDPYERALWNWVNVYNLDAFLQEVYYYYDGKGIYSIALARGLNLLSVMLCARL
jgi:autophagy-related protein 9